MCGLALSAVGKSGTPQNSSTKKAAKPDDIPESIAQSVSGIGKFDGVRSFGEQVKHVACAQFALVNEFEGKKPRSSSRNGTFSS